MDKQKEKTKKYMYLVAAFVGGALLVGVVAFGSGSLLQGNLSLQPVGKTCTATACDVKAMLTNYALKTETANYALKKDLYAVNNHLSAVENALNNLPKSGNGGVSQADFSTLLQHVSDVETMLNGLSQNNQAAHIHFDGMFTDVNTKITDLSQKLDGFWTGVSSLGSYTYSHFTEASNKFEQLGAGGLTK